MMRAPQRAIDQALACLYGPGPRPTDPLAPEHLKRAWRRRARALHPDRAVALGRDPQRMEAAFKRVEAAYRLLRQLDPPAQPAPAQEARPTMPSRRLRFAEYLYLTGWVERDAISESLSWQRRGRPLIGQLAVEWGYLTHRQLGELLRQRRAAPRHMPLARFALERGFLSAHQRARLIRHQRAMRRPVGRYFIEQGLLTPQALDRLLEAHRRHNAAA